MKSIQFKFTDRTTFEKDLAEIKATNGNIPQSAMLFYLSWTVNARTVVADAIAVIGQMFPDAIYYGNDSSGNISNGRLSYGLTVTCSIFERPDSRTELVWVEKGTATGSMDELWDYCRGLDGLKAIELIPTLPSLEELSIDRNVPGLDSGIAIFGGSCINSDNPIDEAFIVAKGHEISSSGMIAILYYGSDLNVSCSYVLGWKGLGSYRKVTRSQGKSIYEIDGMPAGELYEKYLNLKDEDNDNLVFPLIIEEDGIEFIRTPRDFQPDKSMRMIVKVDEGCMTRIAYGDKNTILDSLYNKVADIEKFKPQAIHAYSCACRRLFWGNQDINRETLPLNEIAPVNGFYTGGEILLFGQRLRVLNFTLVLVCLREGEPQPGDSTMTFEKHDKSLISRITHFVGVISAEQEAQKAELEIKHSELSQALSMAQSASRAKTTFLNNMSHDIRTPMNAIKGFTSMALINIGDKERVSGYLHKIDMATHQLLSLINQVLEMSRIESGTIDLNEKPVNIRESYNSIVTILAQQAKDNGQQFTCSIKDISHEYVIADEARMSQITMNVVGNAMKYTQQGGRIDIVFKEIPCAREGFARFSLTVSDNGIGMSPEFQKILFEPFTRESTSTISKIQGTGLGLSIVKKIVDLLGGTINIQSETGHGTTFEIALDLKTDERAALQKPQDMSETQVSFAGKRALLVEDNEMNMEIARFILDGLGLEVEEATDGDIAVDSVRSHFEKGEYKYYDIVLMDIQMPRMNGMDATALIRKIPVPNDIHLPVIAMTANVFEEDRKAAFAVGMDDHIAKPIDRDQLVSVLSKYL